MYKITKSECKVRRVSRMCTRSLLLLVFVMSARSVADNGSKDEQHDAAKFKRSFFRVLHTLYIAASIYYVTLS